MIGEVRVNRVWTGLLGAAAATVAAVVLIPGVTDAAQQGWWSTEGYSVTNSGLNPDEPTLTKARVANLKLHTTSPGRPRQSAPVLDKGRVFVYSADAVTAYDEMTGEQLWRHEQPAGARPNQDGRMLVAGGKLVVAWNSGSPPDGGDYLEILGADTGQVLVAPRFTDGSVRTLLADKGVVVVSGESRYAPDTVAYRLSDGTQLWAADYYMYQPVSANGRILVRGYGPQSTGEVSKILDIRTGKATFSAPYKYYNVLAATPDGATFYLAWGHSLQALDATTGRLSWIASDMHPEYAAVSPSRLYVTTTDHKMIAVNLGDKSIAWTSTYLTDLLRPIVSGGVLYVTAAKKQLFALDPADGSPLRTPAFTVPAYPPVVTGARIYLTDGAKMSIYGL
jgi:outer membrane protein assembly factor BamB